MKLSLLILLAVLLLCACMPVASMPGPDCAATLAWVETDKAACGEGWYQTMGALNDCLQRPVPIPTPQVVVFTPVPPAPLPTPTPNMLVDCRGAELGSTLVITTRTTVRGWHSEVSGDNLGQAEAGETGILIDKSMDSDALWWWRASGLVTNDYPYGTTGWVKALYSGCAQPE